MTVRYLKNANITHVSYVDKGANKKKFFMTKSEKEPNLQKNITALYKEDDEKQLVYGVVYEPNIEDAHGDAMSEPEIEKAAHGFMQDARKIDKQHDYKEGYGEVVESYVAPADFEYGGETIAKGSWVLVTKANDETWESIKKGEITGYSMAGVAEYEEVAKQEDSLVDKIEKAMKRIFSKGEVEDRFYDTKLSRDFRASHNIFESILIDELIFNDAPNTQRISEAARDMANLFDTIASSSDVVKSLGGKEAVQASLLSPGANTPKLNSNAETPGKSPADIEKTHQTNKEEEQNMNEELKKALQEVVAEAVAPFEKKVEELEGKVEKTEVTPTEEEVEKEEAAKKEKQEALKKELKGIVGEALEPLEKRLETVEKTRGVNKSAEEGEGKELEKSDDAIWDGLI